MGWRPGKDSFDEAESKLDGPGHFEVTSGDVELGKGHFPGSVQAPCDQRLPKQP